MPFNGPRRNCGTHFGSSSFLASELASFCREGEAFIRALLNIILAPKSGAI